MKYLVLVSLLCVSLSCTPSLYTGAPRTFRSSFESIADFQNADYSFYIVPTNYLGTTFHTLTNERVFSGTNAHKAWVDGTNAPSSWFQNNNHRGYPTVQFQKTREGVYRTPVLVTLHVWLDMPLAQRSPENEWFSFMTLTPDTSDGWDRTVLLNLSWDGIVHLMHVPEQGQQVHTYQNTSLIFPQRRWVELKLWLDLDASHGRARAWMDGVLVSEADVRGGNGTLAQAHFGLYCAPSVATGVIYNDELEIVETNGL